MKKLKFASFAALLLFGLTVIFTSCEKDPEAMNLPPAESMAIDMEMFPEGSTKGLTDEATIENWFFSAGTILVWQVVLVSNVAIPVAAYAAAFNHTPVYLGDNTWEWSYSVTLDGSTYVASLIGARINNEEFSMEMYLSKSGLNGFENFKWFTGVVRYDHTAASWSMNYSPANPVALLDIDYTKNFETGVADIRYTCVDPANELYNDYIQYGVDSALDFNAYYTVMKDDGSTFIEWSTTTSAGRVMSQSYFLDELWHCWDTQLQDVVCPVEE